MIERLLERSEPGNVEYVALDLDPENSVAAARRLQSWAAGHGARWSTSAASMWRIETSGARVDVRWVTASLTDASTPDGSFDAVLAQSFLDLVDLDAALPRLLGALRPGGLFYFSLNFDGLTAFLPEIEAALDRAIVNTYHASMDVRRDGGRLSGGSQTGRRLLVELPRHGGEVLAAGASDWIVFPRDGKYPDGEGHFLTDILGMVETSVRASGAIPAEQLSAWVARRRRQVDEGQLIFIAHQLDVTGRRPGG